MAEMTHLGRREKWWVLRHLDPKLIDQQLQLLNEQRERDGKEGFIYVIPHQYAREAEYNKTKDKHYNDEVRKNNDLRSSLHYYLFIKATEDDINALVYGDWNRDVRCRLCLCRSWEGEPLWASAKDMDALIALLVRYREMFNLMPAPLDFTIDDKVMLKSELFNGYEFYVKKIRAKSEGVSLTLELPLFNGRFILQAKDLHVSDEHMPMKLKELLSPDYVRDMEHGLITILRHRVRHTAPEAGARSDYDNLNNFHYLSCLDLDDTPTHNHIRTLLLFCAALRKDQRSIEAFVPVIEGLLPHRYDPATDEEAFMMAVLFVATRKIAYRTAVKQYAQGHTDLSEPLALLLPLIKDIKVRNTRNKTVYRKLNQIIRQQSRLTLQQLHSCNFGSLSPQAARAIATILALPQNQTAQGRQLQARLQEVLPSDAPVPQSPSLTPDTFEQMRRALLRNPSPDGDTLTAYYHALHHLFPHQDTSDSKDLYDEFLALLLKIYPTLQPRTTSWWQLKAILEHYQSRTPRLPPEREQKSKIGLK